MYRSLNLVLSEWYAPYIILSNNICKPELPAPIPLLISIRNWILNLWTYHHPELPACNLYKFLCTLIAYRIKSVFLILITTGWSHSNNYTPRTLQLKLHNIYYRDIVHTHWNFSQQLFQLFIILAIFSTIFLEKLFWKSI